MEQAYIPLIESLIGAQFHTKPESVTYIGGGFYGRVFLAKLDHSPYHAVVKIYLQENLHRKEYAQLTLLAKHATIPMPQVYAVHDSHPSLPIDALIMEYIEGVNAGVVVDLTEQSKEQIAHEIIDNLIAYHRVVHPDGFGQLHDTHFEKDWRAYYQRQAEGIVHKAAKLHEAGQLHDKVLRVVHLAYAQYEEIFSEPIEEARLIHGDYNTWNVLLSPDMTRTVAVIDPFNCSYADSEMDLYQLMNANGNELGLLELYRSKRSVSANFEVKMAFYRLFSEIMHYYDAEVACTDSTLQEESAQLEDEIRKWTDRS